VSGSVETGTARAGTGAGPGTAEPSTLRRSLFGVAAAVAAALLLAGCGASSLPPVASESSVQPSPAVSSVSSVSVSPGPVSPVADPAQRPAPWGLPSDPGAAAVAAGLPPRTVGVRTSFAVTLKITVHGVPVPVPAGLGEVPGQRSILTATRTGVTLSVSLPPGRTVTLQQVFYAWGLTFTDAGSGLQLGPYSPADRNRDLVTVTVDGKPVKGSSAAEGLLLDRAMAVTVAVIAPR
jgi:hypothetical protein